MAFYLLDKRNVESDEKRPLVIWNKKNDITFQDLDEDSFDEALEFIEVSKIDTKYICIIKNKMFIYLFLVLKIE